MSYVVPWWSPSKFMCWDECPQEFYRRYVLREPIEPNTPMFFGTAVHKGLEAHFRGEDGDLAFRREWRKACTDLRAAGLHVIDLTSIGLDLLDKVVGLGIVGVPERKIWIRCEAYLNAPLLGYVDLWCADTHTLVDFKTTLGAWSAERAEREMWQPCLYSWAYWLETGTLPAFEYIVLNRGTGELQRFKTQRTHQQVSDTLSRAREIAVAVAAEQWACTCGKHDEQEAA